MAGHTFELVEYQTLRKTYAYIYVKCQEQQFRDGVNPGGSFSSLHTACTIIVLQHAARTCASN